MNTQTYHSNHRTYHETSSASHISRLGQLHRAFGHITLGLITLLVLTLSSPAAHAQDYNNEETLHSFTDGNDGAYPLAGLINIGGILYGTTNSGGTSGGGTVFSIHTDGTGYQVLHSFGSGTDGIFPESDLIEVNGVLYGTTVLGGIYESNSLPDGGTVFSINPDGTGYKTLHSFSRFNDGDQLIGALINVNGTLYGTTSAGGSYDAGTVFSIHTDGTGFNTLHKFAGGNAGDYPVAALINVNGILYGTTQESGNFFNGFVGNSTIFSIHPDGTAFQILHNFTGNSDGGFCSAPLMNVNGILYGTTEGGGNTSNSQPTGDGTLFAIHPDGTGFQTLYSFTGGADGANPEAGLININGSLYGTTEGSDVNSNGTVFSIHTDGTGLQTLYTFQGGGDGAHPRAALLNINGGLYGTTAQGGTKNEGTIFSLGNPIAPTTIDHYVRVPINTTLTDPAPGVLGNVYDGGSSPVTAALVTNVAHGSLTLNADGSFTYTPTPGFAGIDTFTYQAVNAVGSSNIATVYLAVVQAPIAIDHYVRVLPNTTLTDQAPGVLGNVNDGGVSPMTASLVTNVSHGTLSLYSDGSFVYTPTAGFVGYDKFTYQATNAIGTSNIATTYLSVGNPTAPIAITHYVRVHANTTLIDAAPGVLGNVNDGGSSPMTATLVSNVSHGTLTLNSDGSFTYTPTAGFTGVDRFTYQAVNAVGASNIANTYLTVQ